MTSNAIESDFQPLSQIARNAIKSGVYHTK